MTAMIGNKKFSLYYLFVEQTKQIFYVGITSKKVEIRFSEHIKDAKNKKSRSPKKSAKILSELKKGNSINIQCIIDNLSEDDAKRQEINCIYWYKSLGLNLSNVTSGGENISKTLWTEEKRKERSVKNNMRGVHGSFHPTSIEVNQLSLSGSFIKKWENQTEAAAALKIHKQGISKCCLGVINQSGGFKWAYADLGKRKNHPKNFKSIDLKFVLEQLNLGKTKTEIAKILGVQRHTIARRLNESP